MTRSARGRVALRQTVWWALWGAAGAAGAQVAISWVKHLVLHQFLWVSRDFTWMAPLGTLRLFGLIAVPLLVLLTAAPVRLRRLPAVAFGSLAALAILVLLPWLHPLAALALAVAFGVRVSLTPAGGAAPRVVPRGALVLLASLGVAGAALSATQALGERRARAALGAAPPAPAPNVLLIILDTVRAASMSFMGYGRETTPHLAALARDGVVFEHAYATAPWTLPSHAGVFSAHYPSQLTADWRIPLQDTVPLLAEAFRDAGYETVGFAANHFYTSWESGLTRGFTRYRDYRRTAKQALLSVPLLQTEFFWSVVHDLRPSNVARQVRRLDLRTQVMWTSDRLLAGPLVTDLLAWERERANGTPRPFFAFVNLYDAHLPYDPPPAFRRKFAASPTALDRYDAAIAYMDAEVGRLLDSLRVRGELDRTVVIVTADHGEGFGEHGLSGHGNSLYRPELHVPLIVRYPPRFPAGRRIGEAVSLRDLAATALDLAGLQPTRRPPGVPWLAPDGSVSPGRSPVISEVSAGINTEPHLPVSRGRMRSLIDEVGHYIRNGDGVEELYDYRTDTAEASNRATLDMGRVTDMRRRSEPPRAAPRRD